MSEKRLRTNADSKETRHARLAVPSATVRLARVLGLPRRTRASAMSPSHSQAGRWLAKAGERSSAYQNAPGSVNSRRSGDLPPDNYGHSERYGNDEYRARGTARYASAESEVRHRVVRKPPLRPETDHARSSRALFGEASRRHVVTSRAKSSRSAILFLPVFFPRAALGRRGNARGEDVVTRRDARLTSSFVKSPHTSPLTKAPRRRG